MDVPDAEGDPESGAPVVSAAIVVSVGAWPVVPAPVVEMMSASVSVAVLVVRYFVVEAVAARRFFPLQFISLAVFALVAEVVFVPVFAFSHFAKGLHAVALATFAGGLLGAAAVVEVDGAGGAAVGLVALLPSDVGLAEFVGLAGAGVARPVLLDAGRGGDFLAFPRAFAWPD